MLENDILHSSGCLDVSGNDSDACQIKQGCRSHLSGSVCLSRQHIHFKQPKFYVHFCEIVEAEDVEVEESDMTEETNGSSCNTGATLQVHHHSVHSAHVHVLHSQTEVVHIRVP